MARRAADILISGLSLLVLSPLLVAVALAVRLDSVGPAIYCQRRVGRYGREFTIYKFRSMRPASPGEKGPQITASGDARVTGLGRLLRRMKIDELPQLWNVFRGDMSLVGPRPETPKYVALYTERQRRVLEVRPGVTDASSLEFLDEEALLASADDPEAYYRDILLPRKLALSLEHSQDQSLRSYFMTVAATIGRVVAKATRREVAGGGWRIDEDSSLRGFSVEWAEGDRRVLSRRNELFVVEGDRPARPLAVFPAPRWKRWLSRWRPLQRALRFSFYNVVELPDGRLLATFDKAVGVLDDGAFRIVKGLVRPTRVLRGGCAVCPDGRVYFGEYLGNAERGPIHVYEFDPSTNAVRVAHTFAAGEVRHVHGVFRDPYTEDLYCTTGDLPSECRLLRTADRFATVEAVGEGDETWRAVTVLPTSTDLWYATDSQYAPNRLYRLPKDGTGRVAVADLPGPVYSAKQTATGMFFSVTAELCPSQSDRHASLWCVDSRGGVAEVTRFAKDWLPNRYFQHGVVNFPAGNGDGPLVFQNVALRRSDNCVFEARRAA